MKKLISMLLVVIMTMGALTGCTGTTVVYYSDCTCAYCSGGASAGTSGTTTEPTTAETQPAADGTPVKTGLAIIPSAEGTNATVDKDGNIVFDVTYVAVNVDDKDVITACVIDSLKASVSFDTAGAITSDIAADVLTKTELGADYGMVAWGGAVAEWHEQAAALAAYAVGKTYDEVLNGAIDESGYAADADLATSATMYLGSYVYAIGAAVGNAAHLGAQSGDELKLTTINSLTDSATGSAVLTSDVAAVTMNGDVITSCVIDSLQAAVALDETGAITTDLTAGFPTKTQLGYDYGMVAWADAKYEWFEQTAKFCAYVTGKTPAEVAGIAVDESTKATDADLATSVTIAIGGFQALIAKAAQ